MKMKFSEAEKLRECITAGFGLEPKKDFSEFINDDKEVDVIIFEDIGCFRLDIECTTNLLTGSLFSYSWSLVDVFCTLDDEWFMENIEKCCNLNEKTNKRNMNKAIFLCEEFGKNGVKNRLAYRVLNVS